MAGSEHLSQFRESKRLLSRPVTPRVLADDKARLATAARLLRLSRLKLLHVRIDGDVVRLGRMPGEPFVDPRLHLVSWDRAAGIVLEVEQEAGL